MNITFEKLPPERWQEYKELRLEALKKDPLAFGTSYEEASADPDEKWKARLEDTMGEKSGLTIFALDGDNPIGMMTVFWTDKDRTKHVVNLVGVYVNDKYRGQGIASKILENILERIKAKRQFKKIRLQVAAYNEPAKKLYEKFGFIEVGFLKEELYADGKYYDDVLMELYL